MADAYGLYDRTNAPNAFQGIFRYSWFDLPAFTGSLALDRKYAAAGERIAVAVTHLDMTGGMLLCPEERQRPEELADRTGADMLYQVSSETAADMVCQPVNQMA